MNKLKILNKTLNTALMLLILLTIVSALSAQVRYSAKNDLNLSISGTSTLHEWDMKASKGECVAVFTFNSTGEITALTSLIVNVPAEALKGEHTAMDKTAYKALKTNIAPTISYKLTSATVTSGNTIKCTGKLTIAGTTREADVTANYKLNSDKSINVSGNKNLSMKDFNIEPPSFMMGTIKTRNDMLLKFDLTLRK